MKLRSINIQLTKGCGIVKEPPGVISEDEPAWVWLGPGPYLYAHQTFFGLLWMVLTGWKKDRHLCG